MRMANLDVARVRPPQAVLALLPPRLARGLGALPVAVAPDGAVTVCDSHTMAGDVPALVRTAGGDIRKSWNRVRAGSGWQR